MIEYALIVAGGSGARMQSNTPKQFMLLGELPILMHTINAFHRYSNRIQIVLVLPESQFANWATLVEQYNYTIPHTLVPGGLTRYESVQNGLNKIEGNGLVAIHDGVRPFVTPSIIKNCFARANDAGAAVTVVTPKDSIRELSGKTKNKTVNRENYRLVQTPQTFNIKLIKQAYATQPDIGYTDDASVAEDAGYSVSLVEGDYKNIKITTPEDIKIAQALLADINDLSN